MASRGIDVKYDSPPSSSAWFDMVPVSIKGICEQYGFRMTWDESVTSFSPKTGRASAKLKKNPWMHQITCKYGYIYPHSDKLFGFFCRDGKVRNKLHRSHPAIHILSWSDNGEAIFIFPLNAFLTVQNYAQPKMLRVKVSGCKSENS